MRGLTFLTLSVLLMGTAGLALAQTTTPVPTATSGSPTTKAEIKSRIREQEARIKADSRVGKLTTGQADSHLADLKAIKDKLKADYVENGKKELTSDQKTELNNLLDESGKSIGNHNGLQNFN
jgi:hypothetical protein